MTPRALVRHGIAVACFVSVTAGDARAFHIDFHVEVTQDALGRVGRELPDTVKVELRRAGVTTTGLNAIGFTEEAAQEVLNANKSRDLDDCGQKGNPDVPAVPCTRFGTESAAAIEFLSKEPAEDHFDAESFVLASDNIYLARGNIRQYLKDGRFVAARKALGGALHAIQDFYAHSNWVELGSPGIENRIGTQLGFRAPGRRVAEKNEPTCRAGDRPLASMTPQEQQALLVEYQKVKLGDTAERLLLKLFSDKALTTGFYYNNPVSDIPEIEELGKCRHGWEVPALGLPAQTGINKDRPNRTNFTRARQLAYEHTFQFVMDVIKDPTTAGDPNYPTMVLGLLGRGLVEGVTLGVPGAPNGEYWDTMIGGVLSIFTRGIMGLRNFYPDVLVCLGPANRPMSCAPVCDDANWSETTFSYECQRELAVPAEAVRVLVQEVDLGQARRVIADFTVRDPTKCNPSNATTSGAAAAAAPPSRGTPFVAVPDGGACRVRLDTEGRQVWVQFQLRGSPELTPPAPATSNTPPPNAPPAPGPGQPPPPTVTAVPPPVGPAGPSTGLPPVLTGPVITGPSTTGPSTTGPNTAGPSTVGPSTVGPPATTTALTPRLPTAAEIDAILNLRDGNACTGSDAFVPPGTAFIDSPLGQQLGQARAAQLYQMAAFAMAIADPAVKAKVLSAIQSRVGDDAFFGAMTQVIGDVQQSRALVAAYQGIAQNVVSRVTATGLDRLLTPPRAAVADVGAWILKVLTSDALVANAVGMMSAGPSSALTAECTLNELAKNGFAATVGAR